MTLTAESFKPILAKLVSNPAQFTSEDTEQAIEHLATTDGASPAQIGAFLTALKFSGKEHTPETLVACAKVMRNHALACQVDNLDELCVDIVGTGGDGHNTFNVSTSAAIVAAGAGARVVKHGNRASTSSSGSADVLRALGCSLPAPPTSSSPSSPYTLPSIPFTFLLASHYHPAMAHLAPHRKSLPFRTLFNIIGPLINPARPSGMIIGVANPSLGPVFAQVLSDMGVKRALVVCGFEELDEISIAGPTWAWSIGMSPPGSGTSGSEPGKIEKLTLEPSHFGLASHPLVAVAGGSPEENATVLTAMLTPGAEPVKPSNGASVEAIKDFILINAAALLVVADVASTYEEGVKLARESIESGKALEALDTFRNQS